MNEKSNDHNCWCENCCSGRLYICRSVASMIQETIAKFSRIEMFAMDIQLFDCIVEDIMSQTNIFWWGPTPFIAIGRQICTISAIQCAQAITCNGNRCWNDGKKLSAFPRQYTAFMGKWSDLTSFALDHFHTNVIVFGTLFAPIADATPMEILRTSGRCWCASIAPNCRTFREFERSQTSQQAIIKQQLSVHLHCFRLRQITKNKTMNKIFIFTLISDSNKIKIEIRIKIYEKQ